MIPGKDGQSIQISVRTKILVVFLVLSVSALLIAGILSSVQMADVNRFAIDRSSELGNKAGADSAAALERDAQASLLRLAEDQADLSNVAFERVGGEIGSLTYYASEIMTDPTMVRPRQFYLQTEKPPDRRSTSLFYPSPGAGQDISAEEKNAAGTMDQIFIPIYSADSTLSAEYVTTESGISMIYPWTSGLDPNFDPRDRDWFKKAQKSGKLTWSDPYVDILGHGLMITCSKSIDNPQKGWRWVVGTDMTIETINQNIISTQVGNRGYAMLIDEHGNVISRPGLSAGDQRWDESFVTENLLESSNPDLVGAAREMIAGKTGIARVRFDDGDRFVAYAPVKSVNWSVAVVRPVDEVIAPALATKDSILNASAATASHMAGQQAAMRNAFAATFLVLLVVVVVLTLIFSRFLTEPLLKLQKGSEAIGKGDLDYRVDVRTRDEFGHLARSFNQMAADLKQYISTLRQTTAEKERMLKELEIAKGIQQSFLPDAAPEIPGIDLQGYNLPAAEVGGDFYDFIPAGTDSWGLVIADVSGKGVPAALFMALSRTLIRSSTTRNHDPAASIREANRDIYLDSKTSMFVTLFYAILNARKKTLTFVNAGHNPPLLFGAPAAGIKLLNADGIALGVVDDIELESVEVALKKGDVVVLYTDGVTEACNENDEEYGVERLQHTIESVRSLSSKEIIATVVKDITAFAGNRPQFDDITLMVLKVE